MSEEKELALYELSMHLIPSLSADDAQAEHEKIVARIEKEGGSVKMNQLPEDRALTYEEALLQQRILQLCSCRNG